MKVLKVKHNKKKELNKMTNEITGAWAENTSKVVMPLHEYTDMMIEDTNIKNKLKVALGICERMARKDIADSVSTYSIGCLKKESCEAYLKSSDDRLIGEFSYSSSLKEVFADYPCFELREIRAWTVEFIKDGIRKRLAELKEQEDSQQ